MNPFSTQLKFILKSMLKPANISKMVSQRGYAKEAHPLYSCTEVNKNVFFIQEKYFVSWNLANIFFIKGRDRDLLIDTGIGLYSLPSYLEYEGLRQDMDKPLDVVLTHLHFDHTGGAHQFNQVYMHETESNLIRKENRYMTASWVTGREVVPKPHSFRPNEYSVKPAKVLDTKHGDVFNLGDREFEVLHIPGHSPGSCALLDKQYGILATGDTLYKTDHGLIDWYPGSDCNRMKKSVEMLVNICHENQIESVLPGHNEVLSALKGSVTEMTDTQPISKLDGEWPIKLKADAPPLGAVNQVLTPEEAISSGENYLKNFNALRTFRKMLSRARANLVFGAKSKLNLPEGFREITSN